MLLEVQMARILGRRTLIKGVIAGLGAAALDRSGLLVPEHATRSAKAAEIHTPNLIFSRDTAVSNTEASLQAESLPPGTFPTDAQFQERWDRLGGLPQNGYALSPTFSEIAEDGKPYDVQYFERAKFELHPAEPDPEYKIMLSRLGVNEWKRTYPGRPVDATTPIDPKFTEYWNTRGGLYQQGLPLGPAETLMAEDGKPYYTQFFERSVFEYHPKNTGTPYDVLLKRVGANELKSRYPNGFPAGSETPPSGERLFPEILSGGQILVQNHGLKRGFKDSNFQMIVNASSTAPGKFEWHVFDTPEGIMTQLKQLRSEGLEPKVGIIDWSREPSFFGFAGTDKSTGLEVRRGDAWIGCTQIPNNVPVPAIPRMNSRLLSFMATAMFCQDRSKIPTPEQSKISADIGNTRALTLVY